MADDERLREALLELQVLRDREARIHDDTRTLLECLEAYSTAASPGAALATLFACLRARTGADLCLVAAPGADGACEVAASNRPDRIGRSFHPPGDLLAKARNVAEPALTGPWTEALGVADPGGLIVAPAKDGHVLMILREAPGRFAETAFDLALRLADIAAQALRNSRMAAEMDLLAATVSGSSSAVAIADATRDDAPLIYVNRAFEALSGYRSAEILGRNCRFLNAEEHDAPERARLRAAVASRSGGTFLLRNRRKTGEVFWNELTLFPVHDAAGRLRNLVSTCVDVTERVEAANDRDRLRARMEHALAVTEDAFLIVEADGRVAFANAAVPRIFPAPATGWTPGTTFAENWEGYLSRATDMPGRVTRLLREADLAELAALPGGGREVDLPDARTVLLRAGRLGDGGLVVSATDVTAMKTAERLLSQRLAAIEAASDGIAVTDDEGRLTYRNAAAASLLGFGGSDGGFGRTWHEAYPDAGRTRADDPFHAILERHEDGRRLTHEVTRSPLESGGSVIVIRDLTEALARKEREQEMVRELIRLQRQEAVAQLTAGVAHDFNNLLSAINGSATLISMAGGLPEVARPHLDRIAAAGAQAARLTNRLLDIGTASETEGAFDLGSTLSDLPALVRPSLPRRIDLDLRTPARPMTLRGHPGMLSQIVVNLVLNARDAIGAQEGRIAIRFARRRGAQVSGVVSGPLDPEAIYACIEVSDTGAGMDAETSARAFEPYFTTRGRAGSGLGLATVAVQLGSLGGAVALRSAPGDGSTVSVFWPMAPLAPAPAAPEAEPPADLAGTTLIIVDDDEDVSAVMASYLEACGAEVAICGTPEDAIEAVTEDPDAWSAVITDYDMPVMNGGALAERLHRASPDLPVLVVTALARRLTDPRLVHGQVAAILSKPVDLEQFGRAVAKAALKGRRAIDATAAG
ncbi:PAS domain S-box protein [Roseibacterium sp. SDUM158017]|uniref:PAS domain-containing hybrid sensor histidine kinase/response regulator n=1 Tax=Roseicyclus salinarum TaxID=3036773 RepID=UPI0024152882|nr:PAS domain S-box protein [Roseibacterium sp. SDUM158017]MDG4647788.1 PAS domain S-box protein [Roseibacterium sp. SDUM158017]